MRAKIRSLWEEERGVSVVLGAMLMLLIMTTVYGVVQAYHVPLWNKDVEYEHLNAVHDDMMTFKSDVEDVAISEVPKSSVFRMGVRYPNRIFLMNPGPGVAGSLTSDNVAISIEYTIDGLGDPTITTSYTSNRITYEVLGSIDSPKLVYEHGVIIRDYGDEYATTDEQSLIVGDEIYIPVLTGNLTAASSMETESIALKPLSQSFSRTNIESVTITLDTDYPEVWADLLAVTGTDDTTVLVDIDEGEIVITSEAVEQIGFPTGDVTADALYAGLATFSTTSVPEPVFIIGGGTGTSSLDRDDPRYIPMFNTCISATESDVQQSMPMAGTVSNFYVILDDSPDSGNSFTFVVRKNGADTPVTCAISDADTTGSDLTNSVSFAAGDYISIMVTPASRPTARSMCWTAQFSLSQESSTVSTTPPAVTTNDATNITTTGARLNGNLTSLGTATSVSVSFQWGTSPGVYPNTTTPQVMNATGTFYFDLSGLTPGTTYYFRAQAVGQGTAYGSEKSFTTSTTPPAVTTNDATNITTTGARLNGNLTSLGTATSVSVSFQWGTSTGVYPNTTTPQVMNATGTFYFDLSGLTPGTTYYFRAQAVGQGTAYGSEKSFTTSVTITASAGANGTISPSGAIIVAYDASQTFTMNPNTGYYIATLTVDGSPVTPAPRYTFTNVTANHTISVTFAANNNVYAFQGNGQTAFWVYSISGNSWTALTSAPAAVGDGGSLVYDGANSIYAFQGNNLAGFWRYNISSNTWTTLAAAPANVSSGGALQFDGGNYVYAFQGNNKKTFWRYDIAGNSWTELATALANVDAGGSLAYDGGNYMYAFRGNGQTAFWVYSISGDSWTALTSALDNVNSGGALAYDGGNYMYAFRGNNTNTFWRYDISGDSWLALTSALANVNGGGALTSGK